MAQKLHPVRSFYAPSRLMLNQVIKYIVIQKLYFLKITKTTLESINCLLERRRQKQN